MPGRLDKLGPYPGDHQDHRTGTRQAWDHRLVCFVIYAVLHVPGRTWRHFLNVASGHRLYDKSDALLRIYKEKLTA